MQVWIYRLIWNPTLLEKDCDVLEVIANVALTLVTQLPELSGVLLEVPMFCVEFLWILVVNKFWEVHFSVQNKLICHVFDMCATLAFSKAF